MSKTGEPQHIAVFIPNWLGDVVMCTPALRALRGRFPGAQISVVGRATPCALLQGLPGIDQFATLAAKAGVWEARALRHRLPGTPDLAVLFPHSLRAALLARMLGARRVLGYARGGRTWLLTDRVEPHRENGKIAPVYMAREYLDLIAPLGCVDDGQGLSLAVDPAVAEAVRTALPEARPLIAIAPGAAFGPSKRWLPERFAEVADRLREERGAACVLLTGPGEEDTRAAVLRAARHPLAECSVPAPGIERLKAVIAQCDLFIGNDSGPRHIAIAFKKPVICVMGPTKPAYSAGPWERGEVLRVEVDCGPCQKPTCATDHRCMTRIPSTGVYEAAVRWLGNSGAAGD